MRDTTFDFDRMVCFSLYSTANAMVRDYFRPLRECGLTYPQLLVVAALWDRDAVSISALSATTLFDMGTLTPIVKRLAAMGCITVVVDATDRRKKNVALTSKGRDMKSAVAEVFKSMSCKLELSEGEQEQVLSICKKIRARL